MRTVELSSLLKSLRYHLVIFSSRPYTCATTGPSNRLPPCYDYNQSHTKASLLSLPLLETICLSALWFVDTIDTFHLSHHFSTVTGPECLAMISPFPVSYLSLPWGRSFRSVLVCQHNQWNVRSLASLLILQC